MDTLGRTEPWLRAVGFVIWAFTGLSRLHLDAGSATPPWIFPWFLFGAAYLGGALRGRVPGRLRVTLLAVQFASVLALTTLGLRGYEGLLLSIVAAQAPIVLSLRASIYWAVAQLPFLFAIVVPFKHATEVMEIVGAYSTFTAFALLVHWMHQQEVRARQGLARANADLLSTRALMIVGARQGERLRISQELHDSLGHHLTALSIQLELARQLVEGAAAQPVARAHEVAREALADVRRVVREVQSSDGVDLVANLEALAAGIPAPRISIRGGECPRITDREASHAMFRCVQEAITNSLRHAHASVIEVDLARRGTHLVIRVRDDGTGCESVAPGTGLTGMRTRVARLDGELHFGNAPGGGFEVELTVPLASVAS